MSRLLALLLAPVALAAFAVAAGSQGWVPATWAMSLAAVAACLLLLGLAVASARPDLEVFGPAVVRGPAHQPRVALTFDDGPWPEATPALLAALDRHGARATFFLLVDRAERYPALVREIAARHEVALHGPSHDARLAFTAPGRGTVALRDAARRLEVLGGRPVRWYRPPFGVTSPRLAMALSATPLRLVWCSLRTWDLWPGTARVARRVRRARAGEIVLLHERRRACIEALDTILEDLRARGLAAVTVGELLEVEP